MDNFDLKKYLVENKVTTNSKLLNEYIDNIDYNEITGEFNEISDMLINMANKGAFVLTVVDESKNTTETYGNNQALKTPHGTKREIHVMIKQPTYMLVSLGGAESSFASNTSDVLTQQFKSKFPELNFDNDGYNIEIKPKKFIKQGYYGN